MKNEFENPWSQADGILLGYPFDQLLDQECGLLGKRLPGIKFASPKEREAVTAGDILDPRSLARELVDKANACLRLSDELRRVIESLLHAADKEAKIEEAASDQFTEPGKRTARENLEMELAKVINCQLDPGQDKGALKKRRETWATCFGSLVCGLAEREQGQMSTGNIVIAGEPGTAKSTLALQFAASCVRLNNASVPAYISLEASADAVIGKARPFGWDHYLSEVRHIHEVDDFSSADHLADLLKKALSRPKECPIASERSDCRNVASICGDCGKPPFRPCVLLPFLSPRPIAAEGSHDALFARRLRQLERLLEAGQRLNERMRTRKGNPEDWHIRHFLPLVVVDSLNMLGLRPLSRDEIYHLFTLFRRCNTTGVFVVETTRDTPFDSTMADVVISLKREEDQDYAVRYLEVEKSRYYHQVYGRQLFRTLPLQKEARVPVVPDYDPPNSSGKNPRHGVVVFPSLHYLVLKTDRESPLAGTDLTDEGDTAARRRGIETSQKVMLSADDIKDRHALCGLINGMKEPKKPASKRGTEDTRNSKGYELVQAWKEQIERSGPEPEHRLIGALDKVEDRVLGDLDKAIREAELLSKNAPSRPAILRNELAKLFPNQLFGRHFDFGVDAFRGILPPNLTRGQVVMLEGPRGTFKTTFGVSFLAKGFHEEESVLLIRFGDVGLLEEDAEHCLRHHPRVSKNMPADFDWGKLRCVTHDRTARLKKAARHDEADPLWRNLAPSSKIVINVWASTAHKRPSFHPRFFELAFKGGALLPEEFVHIVREILIRRKGSKRIRRVVLDDVSQIGASYPFLHRSRTTGDFFLPAFVHLMRNHRVDLVMTGTTSELAPANAAVGRASALADTVVFCKSTEIFGARYVVISGEGLTAGKGPQHRTIGESVPAVVHLSTTDKGRDVFEVNNRFLDGLVGFEQGSVHRPGILVHAFEENDSIHGVYNDELERMLAVALATPALLSGTSREPHMPQNHADSAVRTNREHRDVSVVPFSSTMSEALHDSFNVLAGGSPIDKTVICTVDEFWMAERSRIGPAFHRLSAQELKELHWEPDEFPLPKQPDGEPAEWPPGAWPYYHNVLLIAYRRKWRRKGGGEGTGNQQVKSWRDKRLCWQAIEDKVRDFAESDDKEVPIRHSFWYDRSATETLSCMFLDALIAGHALAKHLDDLRSVRMNELWGKTGFSEARKLHRLQREQLKSLSSLLQLSEHAYRRMLLHRGTPGKSDFDPDRLLAPDAAVYVCWYSQLRELIDRKPALAKELEVCALPGRGFRGDWSVGIVKGSVSAALGRDVLRELCSKEEDNKRFVRGVGLPVRRAFYDASTGGPGFYAWPNGRHVKLATLGKIHDDAHSRYRIPGYMQVRSTLHILAVQLARADGWEPDIAERVFRQCHLLTHESATSSKAGSFPKG
jgi:KaiC/GvpD/RAD55 family RecA-like ATPase